MRTRKEIRMKKYKLEKRDGNEWSLYGIYTERSLPQLVQAAVQLSKTGYERPSSPRTRRSISRQQLSEAWAGYIPASGLLKPCFYLLNSTFRIHCTG